MIEVSFDSGKAILLIGEHWAPFLLSRTLCRLSGMIWKGITRSVWLRIDERKSLWSAIDRCECCREWLLQLQYRVQSREIQLSVCRDKRQFVSALVRDAENFRTAYHITKVLACSQVFRVFPLLIFFLCYARNSLLLKSSRPSANTSLHYVLAVM